ncbi:hypothetical protein HDV06_001189 [Boothiomyces sp. JEL0866]|nr:hypothetical protein HDV06_001189 [Boothiomyces sp. JEL0866]
MQVETPRQTTSQTITITATETGTITVQAQQPETQRRTVTFDSTAVDNEHLNKKSSKICCIYRKPYNPDDPSSDEDSDNEKGNGYDIQPKYKKKHQHYCFPQYVSTELEKPLAMLAVTKGKLKCPKTNANVIFLQSKLQIVDTLKQMEGVNSAPAFQVDSLRTRLEEALNLTCPWCQPVFLDYDGCDAVLCSKCRKYFCGLCMNACANSSQAHTHAAVCSGANTVHSAQNIKKKRRLLYKQNKVIRLLENLTKDEKE